MPRTERLAKLKEQVQKRTYQVSGAAIADKMLAH
ncbi:flagellar biosynthesis anti-sigma factor FlgM [Aneurinibacillus tyrosinisolvens]|nr:flagellar biosynthesis anti-sigma factor FlgM [Aneurinibacillus tyrosinisolvens]